jgi:hypothetical protein
VIEMEITAKNISSTFQGRLNRGHSLFNFLEDIFGNNDTVVDDKPVASTIASSVSTLMENPKIYIIKNVAIKDTGISNRGRSAIPQSRKKNR